MRGRARPPSPGRPGGGRAPGRPAGSRPSRPTTTTSCGSGRSAAAGAGRRRRPRRPGAGRVASAGADVDGSVRTCSPVGSPGACLVLRPVLAWVRVFLRVERPVRARGRAVPGGAAPVGLERRGRRRRTTSNPSVALFGGGPADRRCPAPTVGRRRGPLPPGRSAAARGPDAVRRARPRVAGRRLARRRPARRSAAVASRSARVRARPPTAPSRRRPPGVRRPVPSGPVEPAGELVVGGLDGEEPRQRRLAGGVRVVRPWPAGDRRA